MKKFETTKEEKAFKSGAFYMKIYLAYYLNYIINTSSEYDYVLTLLCEYMSKKRISLPTEDGNMTFEQFCEKFDLKEKD